MVRESFRCIIFLESREGLCRFLEKEAHRIIDLISEKKMNEVISYLEYVRTKEELEATGEILENEKLLKSIQKGLSQLKMGEIVSLDELKHV